MSEYLKPIIEALIFASPEPITRKTLYKLLDGEPKEDVDAALAAVRADYDRPCGLQIVEVAGGYQVTTKPDGAGGEGPYPGHFAVTWIGNMWANINRTGHGNEFHSRPGAYWSGVYYVDDGGIGTNPSLGG